METARDVNFADIVKNHLNGAEITTIRFLGRELPNLILFKVTFESNTFKILCLNEDTRDIDLIFEAKSEKFDIINGTINPERTFFFFVTASVDKIRASHIRYRSYLSYVRSEMNLCKLGVRHLYTQFQIISPFPVDQAATRTDKSLYLLVMVHPATIELNVIPRELQDSELVISGQGEFFLIVQNYLWAQWEPTSCLLFTICSRGEGELADISTSFTIRQFTYTVGKGPHFVVLAEFELCSVPFPKPIYNERVADLRYDHSQYAVGKCLSDTSINIVALSHSNGSLCLCVQRPTWLSRVQFPSYKVYVLHYKRAMFCSLEPRHNDGTFDHPPIVFLLLNGNTILAINPFFVHVVQISRSSHACISTLLPKLDVDEVNLGSTRGWILASNSTNNKPALFDMNTSVIVTLDIGLESLFAALELASSTLTRALIFHYVIANYRDMAIHRRLLKSILKDPCEPEIQMFLHEYLVTSIFQQFMRRANAGQARFIQHTTLNEDIIQTHAFDRRDRSMIVKITVGTLDSHLFVHKLSRGIRDAFIQNLFYQVAYRERDTPIQLQNEKFVPSLTKTTLPTTTAGATAAWPNNEDLTRSENFSFFEKLRESLSIRRNVKTTKPLSSSLSLAPPSAQTEDSLGRLPFFLANPLYTEEELRSLRVLFSTFLRANVSATHLESYGDTIVNDYLHCVMFQVRQLVHIIWSLTINGDGSNGSLSTVTGITTHDWECFEVLETTIICLKSNGYPVPLQVEDVYSRLAFRLLDLRTLAQYIDCDVLRITEDFACEIFEMEAGVGNNYDATDLLNLKREIVVRFPKNVQVEKLLPRCCELFDFFYRTDHEYRSLLEAKVNSTKRGSTSN